MTRAKRTRPACLGAALLLLAAACQHSEPTSPIAPETPLVLPAPAAGEIQTPVRIDVAAGSPISASALKLSAGIHAAGNNGAVGAANLDTAVVQLLVAGNTNGIPVMLGVVAGRATGEVVLNARSTAEALVLLSPALATSDPVTSRQELSLIDASAKFASLNTLVSARIVAAPATWLAQDDAVMSAAVKEVVLDVLPSIAATVNLERSLSSDPRVAGSNDRNGILVSGTNAADGYTVTIENSRGRWLSVVAELSADNKTFGRPIDLSGFGAALPTIIPSSKLINTILAKPNTSVKLGSNFASARIKVFGLGLGTGGPAVFDDPDAPYVYWPSIATITFDVAMPVLDIIMGIPKSDVRAATDPSGWPRQLILLTGDCVTGLTGSMGDFINSPAVEEAFQARLVGIDAGSILWETMKCSVKSAVENQTVLLGILTAVGKAGALATVTNAIPWVKLPFLLWNVVDIDKTLLDVKRSDALTVFDIVNSAPTRIFAASIGGSLGFSTGPSDLYNVDISSGGVDRLIGRLQTTSGVQPAITDLALTPSGKLWAVSFDQLYRVDSLTGGLIDIGSLGAVDVNALAADANGNLFGATLISQSLIRIDATTGASTIIGQFQGDFTSNGDLVFVPDGRLLAALRTSNGTSVLASIDTSTGKATPVKAGAAIGFDNVWGLTFAGGQLIGLTTDTIGQGTLIAIDLTTGQGTRIRSLSFNAGGAAAREGSHE